MKATNEIGFVQLLPTYRVVPACQHAIAGECEGNGRCPCKDYRPPEGLRGQGVPQAEVNVYWDRQAALHPPAGVRWPEAWA